MNYSKKALLLILTLALVISVFPVTLRAEAKSGTLNNHSVIEFKIPGYDKEQVKEGYTEWDASEMNMKLLTDYPYDTIHSGHMAALVSFDKKALPDGDYSIEFLFDEYNYVPAGYIGDAKFTVKNGKVTTEDFDISICFRDNKWYICMYIFNYEGDINWKKYTEGCPVEDHCLKLTMKTHSTSSKDSGTVTLESIIFQDCVNGLVDIDFEKCVFMCEKFNYFKNARTPWTYTVKKGGKAVDVSKNALSDSYKASEKESNKLSSAIGFSYLPADKTGAPQDNVVSVEAPLSIKGLDNGLLIATFCIRDNSLDDGLYYACINFDNNSGLNAQSYIKDINIRDGKAVLGDSCGHYENGKTYISVRMEYSSKKNTTLNFTSIKFTLESMTNTTLRKSACVYLSGLDIIDYVNGAEAVDLSKAKCSGKVTVYGQTTKEKADYGVMNYGHNIYVANQPQEMIVGEKLTLNTFSEVFSKSSYTYKSSNKKVASVGSKNGKITALKVGSTNITVTDKKNKQTYTFTLKVASPYYTLKSDKTTIMVGQKYYLMAEAHGCTPKSLTWKSSDTKVGTIDSKTGLFTAKKEGQTKITVTDNKKISSSFTIKVTKNNIDPSKYLTIEKNSQVSKEDTEYIYNYLKEIYPKILSTFGSDGYSPYVLIRFMDLSDSSAGAYVTENRDYTTDGGILWDGNHWLMIIGIDSIKSMNLNRVLLHELTHVAQAYSNGFQSNITGYDVLWVTEGLADYSAYILATNPDDADPILTEYRKDQSYNDAYGISASFIYYVTTVHNPATAQYLNEIMKKSSYTDDVWKELTGYTVDELWKQYSVWSKLNQW